MPSVRVSTSRSLIAQLEPTKVAHGGRLMRLRNLMVTST